MTETRSLSSKREIPGRVSLSWCPACGTGLTRGYVYVLGLAECTANHHTAPAEWGVYVRKEPEEC